MQNPTHYIQHPTSDIQNPTYHTKTTKEYVRNYQLFLQNKPKVKYAQINVSSFTTSKYMKMDTWLSGKNKPKTNPKQSQTKPNSKMPKMNVSPIITKDYEKKCGYGL